MEIRHGAYAKILPDRLNTVEGGGGYFFFEGSGVEEAFSIGPPEASHPLMPPSNAPASLNPFCCSKSAARALVCSFGQPQ
jgi:hypothetical protein